MTIDTKVFLEICNRLSDRQARMFVLIHNARQGMNKRDLAEALVLLKLSPVHYLDLRRLQNDGLIECEAGRYMVTRLARQLVKEVQQNERLKKHLQPAPPRLAQRSPPVVQLPAETP